MTEPRPADDLRAELLHALDFAYCSGVGYETPEQMLDAYDAARAAERPAPTSPAAVLRDAADRLDRLGLRDLATRELRRMADEAETGGTR
ncbi:hypothetical protein [Streptomyces sp. SCA2-2]|uniref:hypothetical protein n=1 Tax=Streptomyces sp. SCA2-2 TaxID=1563677 RepID=UPI00101F1168|nr:hypothetical protein [Streptomyces sp. SCA2-2]RZE89156.1 hypothetical protein C0L86_28810 [Streptomyces sp. SCA2-2]